MMSVLCITGGSVVLMSELMGSSAGGDSFGVGQPRASFKSKSPHPWRMNASDCAESALILLLALAYFAFMLRDGVVTMTEAAAIPHMSPSYTFLFISSSR